MDGSALADEDGKPTQYAEPWLASMYWAVSHDSASFSVHPIRGAGSCNLPPSLFPPAPACVLP